jgi:hypothetical protein
VDPTGHDDWWAEFVKPPKIYTPISDGSYRRPTGDITPPPIFKRPSDITKPTKPKLPNGTRPIVEIFPKPPKGGDIKIPPILGPIIEIPLPDLFKEKAPRIFESKGNPNPNINPPGHQPGPKVRLPGPQSPQDWPPKEDPEQTPPETPDKVKLPEKGDPSSHWWAYILERLSELLMGSVDDPTSGGQ